MKVFCKQQRHQQQQQQPFIKTLLKFIITNAFDAISFMKIEANDVELLIIEKENFIRCS